MQKHHTLAVYCPFFDDGGVEHMLVNICRGIAENGHPIDFIIGHSGGHYLSSLPGNVNIVELGTTRKKQILSSTIHYLHRRQPLAVLSAKEPANHLILKARQISGVSFPIYLRSVVNISTQMGGRNFLRRWLGFQEVRNNYRQADGIIAVSHGVAKDISRIAHIPLSSIDVIPNPVVTPEILKLSKEPVDHPWFDSGQAPVILGVGRLGRQKNFSLLIRAFSKARDRIPCRLIIAGQGRRRERLEALAKKLDVYNDIYLPGYLENPYAYMARAKLFALTSNWEGSPNALTEALAIGTPVVSTDCPSGPREILADGKFGLLVPMNDSDRMAEAIVTTLKNPPTAEYLQSAVIEYTMERSAARYLAAMGINQAI